MANREIDPQDLVAQDAARKLVSEVKHLRRQTEVEDFKWLMGNKQGRRYVWRLLEQAGVFRSTFRLDNEMAFLEGMRNMGITIIADIHEICPEKYQLMIKEQQDYAARIRSIAEQ